MVPTTRTTAKRETARAWRKQALKPRASRQSAAPGVKARGSRLPLQGVSVDVICPRCRNKMEEERRSFHKKRKWICPVCGCVRMQVPKGRRRDLRNLEL